MFCTAWDWLRGISCNVCFVVDILMLTKEKSPSCSLDYYKNKAFWLSTKLSLKNLKSVDSYLHRNQWFMPKNTLCNTICNNAIPFFQGIYQNNEYCNLHVTVWHRQLGCMASVLNGEQTRAFFAEGYLQCLTQITFSRGTTDKHPLSTSKLQWGNLSEYKL